MTGERSKSKRKVNRKVKLGKVVLNYSNESHEQAGNQSQEQGFQQDPVTFHSVWFGLSAEGVPRGT